MIIVTIISTVIATAIKYRAQKYTLLNTRLLNRSLLKMLGSL